MSAKQPHTHTSTAADENPAAAAPLGPPTIITTEDTVNPETLALHAGYRADPATNAVAVPIYQTTSFAFESAAHAKNLFALGEIGNIYTRIMNPTNDILEKRLSAIEGGVAALTVSSGQAASALAVQNLVRAGDNIVSSTDLYGGTYNLFKNTLAAQGVEVRFVDPADPENFARASDERTRAYYGELLPNPKLEVFPVKDVADIGRERGIPLIIDNTAAPVLARPLDHGAAVVVHSLTKYIGGHGTAVGGVIIDGGTFEWDALPEQQPALNTPDPSYNGAIWAEAAKPLGPIAYILKARVTLLRDLGAALSPQNAFAFIQGLETLPLRIREHSRNAEAVAHFLTQHPAVASVNYPGLHEGVARERAQKYLVGGQGGLVGIELAGGLLAGQAFVDALRLFYHVANIGDTRSLAIHPASTTQSQLSPEEQAASGVSPGYVRLSIGIEHIDDILADLKQALDHAARVAGPDNSAAA